MCETSSVLFVWEKIATHTNDGEERLMAARIVPNRLYCCHGIVECGQDRGWGRNSHSLALPHSKKISDLRQ
jgi:hypothetical protein